MGSAGSVLGEFEDGGEFLVKLSISFARHFFGRRQHQAISVLFLYELVYVLSRRSIFIMQVLDLCLERIQQLFTAHVTFSLQIEPDETFYRSMEVSRRLI